MISEIRVWSETIIVAILVSVIIESLIPNGNNKKYIKVIIGIYIMFVTFDPILSIFDTGFSFENSIFESALNTDVIDSSVDMKSVYITGIEETIKEDIKLLGYDLENVKIKFDNLCENIILIELKNVSKRKNKIEIEEVKVGEEVINDKYQDIYSYLIQNYFVNEENIVFKN